ncbi:MAG: sulfite exporter TauE/SafE family protein [Clostridiaceae bacterium]|nr:sulfite exporter TauE/SafE family protein [Clostridiaceae bacterium]
MSVILITFLGNFIVGGFIGICGIAGFLLPMMYAGLLGFPVGQSLALSFLAFFVSGAIGSYNYHKQGNLDVRFSIIISIGSFFGGLLGVKLNALITPVQAKMLLYLVVLLSGISILCRKDKPEGSGESKNGKQKKSLLDSSLFVILFGFITGAVCSLSGAGGPVLVMPLLVALGMPVHMSIGVALFDSVFIALPACAGYMMQCDLSQLGLLFAVTVLAHGAGVVIGSSNAHKIKQKPLKMGVAVFSIAISAYMIVNLLN